MSLVTDQEWAEYKVSDIAKGVQRNCFDSSIFISFRANLISNMMGRRIKNDVHYMRKPKKRSKRIIRNLKTAK